MPRLIFVACALMGTEERTKPVLSRSTNPRLLSAKLKPKHRALTSHRPFANIDAGCFPASYQQDLERLRKAPFPTGRVMGMNNHSRRSVLRGSLGLAAAATLVKPYIAMPPPTAVT